MRILLAIAFFTAALCAATAAQAERRMFIVTNNADGYGVNRCLSSGDKKAARRQTHGPVLQRDILISPPTPVLILRGA